MLKINLQGDFHFQIDFHVFGWRTVYGFPGEIYLSDWYELVVADNY